MITGSDTGAPNGPRRQPFDRWFRYPAGFGARAIAETIGNVPAGLIVDPFAGAATIGTRVCATGRSFAGIEAHPEIAHLANLKFARDVDTEAIRRAGVEVAAGIDGVSDQEYDLVRRSFNGATLAALVGMRNRIESLGGGSCHSILKWALLASLREVASVRVGWPYQQPGVARSPRITDARRAFLRRVGWMVEDLESVHDAGEGRVIQGDSRTQTAWVQLLGAGQAAAVVSSPPYLNNFDYADATRLEAYFWRTVGSWEAMCRVIRSDMITATTQQTRKAAAVIATEELTAIAPRAAVSVEEVVQKLAVEVKLRARGKEYDRLVPMYFHDIAQVLQRMSENCVDGASVQLVVGDSAPYGVYINTPRLIEAIAVELGFDKAEGELIRMRGRRWATNGTRHTVLLREEVVRLRAPHCAPRPTQTQTQTQRD